MIKYHTGKSDQKIAELSDKTFIIREVGDILDLIADIGQNDCNSLIIYKYNLTEEFFDLKTKIAGEILQKISNYRCRLAIIGDFSGYTSKSLNDFIRECNRGRTVAFCDDLETALARG
jgi:hypothetical protein